MSKLQPLSPLQHGVPIVDSKGGPAQQFQRMFNSVWGNLQTLLSAANNAQATADAAVPQSRQIISGNGLTGGGPLTADLTLAVGAGVGIAADADAIRIANTAVTPATYGDATHVGQFTVDAQGRLTLAASVLITYPSVSSGGGLLAANNLSDVANAGTSRSNLGLGTAAVKATGTSGNTVPLLDGANTWSAAQTDSALATFSAGANMTPATAPATNAAGYLGAPQNIQNASYTTVMGDAGKHLYHTSGSAHTWTIDSNANVAYPIGTILTFLNENAGGVVTLAITSDTLRWGSSTGSRSLAANGTATAIKVTSTVWRLTGDGIT